MNKTVFVVTAGGGDHDYTWSDIILVCATEDEAKAHVTRLEQQRDKLKFMKPRLETVKGDYLNEHPIRFEPEPVQQRGPSKTTKENMKAYHAAMDAWRTVANEVNTRNNAKWTKAFEDATAAAANFARELGATDDDIEKMGFANSKSYSYANFTESNFYYVDAPFC